VIKRTVLTVRFSVFCVLFSLKFAGFLLFLTEILKNRQTARDEGGKANEI